jgi:hypothetical protein
MIDGYLVLKKEGKAVRFRYRLPSKMGTKGRNKLSKI